MPKKMLRCCLFVAVSAAGAGAAPRAGAFTGEPPAPRQAAPVATAWETDDQGRQYRIEALEKSLAVKTEDGRIRTVWGVQADLAREDDTHYYLKVYRVGPAPKPEAAPPSTPRPAPEPMPKTSDRLRFTNSSAGLPDRGQWRDGLALADIDGDGRLDIVMGSARKSLRPPMAFVWQGTRWSAWSTWQLPPRPYDYGGVAVGDFDGDRHADIALGVHLRGLIALRGGGEGQFADASAGLPFAAKDGEPVFSSRAVSWVDCNGDGRLDLVALGEGPRLPTVSSADMGDAHGLATFVWSADHVWREQRYGRADRLFGDDLAWGDVDGDGKPDMVTASGRLGDRAIVHRGDGACGWTAESVSAIRPRSYVTAVAASDIDKDGRAEVIVGYTDFSLDDAAYGVDVIDRGVDGTWTRRPLMRQPERERVGAVAAGDLDGDGHVDVVALGKDGHAMLFRGDGRGGFTRERRGVAAPARCAGVSAAIADVDADGRGDLVLAYAQESSASSDPAVCPSEGALAVWRGAKR